MWERRGWERKYTNTNTHMHIEWKKVEGDRGGKGRRREEEER